MFLYLDCVRCIWDVGIVTWAWACCIYCILVWLYVLYYYTGMCDKNIMCLGPIRTCKKCQKPVALCYWYSTWRCRVNHRAVEWQTVAVATVNAKRLASGLCPPGSDGELRVLFGQQRLAMEVWLPGYFLPVSA